jgi:two-component system, OmpR family, sensor histidine kinase CpxA
MHRLFWKIFFCFWATVVAIAMAIAATFALNPQRSSSPWHEMMLGMARYSGMSVIEEAELHSAGAASTYIENLGRHAHTRACLVDEDTGNEIADDGCALFMKEISMVRSTSKAQINYKDRIARVALPLESSSGKKYIYATEIPAGTSGISKGAIVTRISLAIFVSFCICYGLTKYLTDPILRLREASHRLASGDLSSRTAKGLERRSDELGFLVRDFNTMAERIEDLISRQRQLIYDISHELRSPLARLSVALDLARERKGDDSAFTQAECDLERMNEMIGRMLTVAKLDTSPPEVQMMRIDIGELVLQVAHSAEFELRERKNAVRVTFNQQFFVHGNAELLHSAIENVIRNAIRYSPPDTPVDIGLKHVEREEKALVQLSVRDYGSGIAESELSNIFRPFYRVGTDRDRQSGGVGLGLAIADRVVRLHGGTISAGNVSSGGLCVDIFLPAADNTGLCSQ